VQSVTLAQHIFATLDAARSATPPADPEALTETLLAAKAANEHVLQMLAYYRLADTHPGIFAQEVGAAIDAALSGSAYQPINKSHGAEVEWTRDRLRAERNKS
jgi:hypothetical protein